MPMVLSDVGRERLTRLLNIRTHPWLGSKAAGKWQFAFIAAAQMHVPMALPRALRTADLGGNRTILRATLPRVPWRSLDDVKCPGLCETKPSSSNNQRLSNCLWMIYLLR
jgi:hypothetical protein